MAISSVINENMAIGGENEMKKKINGWLNMKCRRRNEIFYVALWLSGMKCVMLWRNGCVAWR
jgi:hypothetical protein